MRRIRLMTVGLWVVAGGMLWAEEAKPDKDAQAEKVKALRTSVLNKMPAVTDILDNEHNGVNAAYNTRVAQYQAAIAALSKRLDAENARPAEAQDKAAIAGWNAKLERVQAMWIDRTKTDGPKYIQRLNLLGGIRNNLVNLVTDLANIDQVWMRAECDRALLASVYAEMDKRADEIKTEATALVAGYLKDSADDERYYKEQGQPDKAN